MKDQPLAIIQNKQLVSALDLSLDEWKGWFFRRGLPAFCAKQVVQWIHQKGVLDPQKFTNLAKSTRETLCKEFSWKIPKIDSHLISIDTSEKFLLETDDKHLFEMVLMPYDNRVTLCISSQVGCRMGCTFCQTGKMGLKRHLSSGEILSQLLIAQQHLHERKITNVVFMGMGEPLDNYDEVVKACRLMVDENGWGLSMHRVTVSTSGIVPQIKKLGKELPVRLAISLHEADDEKRSKMMPVNRQYPLSDLKQALLEYPAPKRFGITIEYVMIEGKNDSISEAKKLVKYLSGAKSKGQPYPYQSLSGYRNEAFSS